jgi:histidinol-phosphate aminotransferase
MDICAIARPEIVAMKAYESARNTAAADGILLNANEAPFPLVDEPDWQRLELNRYPSPRPAELVSRLAGIYGVSKSNVLITRGSDEGIDLLTRVFCRAGQDSIVECPPCFAMYRIAASIQGAKLVSVPRQAEQGYSIDISELERVLDSCPDVKLVFLTTPNNPTGDLVDRPDLERVLKACENKALLVLDEAYIEFCSAKSACELIGKWPQLVVLRTLSKAWAAAGLRCGTVIADPVVIDLLQRVIAPYPLPAMVIDAALRATSHQSDVRKRQLVASVEKYRNELLTFIGQFDWVKEVWAGESNFVLMRVSAATELTRWCAQQGIRIRDFSSQPLLEGCVRLTIGSSDEMSKLKSALAAFGDANE